MNDIKQLEERIAQLTELVKTRREQESKFERVGIGESYFYVFLNDYGAFIVKETESNELLDRELYKTNNYFHTEQRAQEVADKINLLLKLERLHDVYCPEYVPDWNDNDTIKYMLWYDTISKRYGVDTTYNYDKCVDVYFPTGEIAQKVCDILNAELEEKK